MNEGMPDERRLRGIEQQVLIRIRRRAAIRTRVASGAAGAALLLGAVVLVHPVLQGASGSSGSGGGTAGGASRADSTAGIVCHTTSDAHSAVTIAPLPQHADAAAAAAACLQAAPKAAAGSAFGTGSSPSPSDLVVCRGAEGGYSVFPKDAHPATLCLRNGLKAG